MSSVYSSNSSEGTYSSWGPETMSSDPNRRDRGWISDISDNDMENETVEEEPVLVIPYLVPPSFLLVVDGIYISAFPNVTHLDLYDALRIKTVVRLTHTPYSGHVQRYFQIHGIQTYQFVEMNVNLLLAEVWIMMMSARNHPMVIHCDDSQVVKASIGACFRKIQGWNFDDILEEFYRLAPRAHVTYPEFIDAFNPAPAVENLAQLTRVDILDWLAGSHRSFEEVEIFRMEL